MKIVIKNFKQDIFEIEISETNTVFDLKKKFEELSKNEYPADSQTLIYAGVILDNNKRLEDYKIDEKKFLVVLKQKQQKDDDKGKPKFETSAGTRLSTTTSSSPPPPPPPPPPTPFFFNSPAQQPVSQSQVNTVPTSGTTSSHNITESITDPLQIRNIINNIVEMGYPEELVIQALRASYNNPERAVEYLVNGMHIPTSDEVTTQQNIQNFSQHETYDNNEIIENISENGSGTTPLAFLRNDPRFQQMRRLLTEDPSLLNGIITQIGQTNPRLLQLIRENQDEFVQLLHEPDPTNQTPPNSNAPIIAISQQERDAIERLKALGYPEDLVIQAYFACDKNEQQAANFLLSQNDDD